MLNGTRSVRETAYAWTGVAQSGCAWRALRDPFVARVMDAYPWFESGQIATIVPSASHRLIEGISYYHRMMNVCHAKQMELQREEDRKK